MALLRVVDLAGEEHEVEGTIDRKLMETLRELDFGVAAICGGMCSCATCHVYVDKEWADQLPEPEPVEQELISELAHARPGSRLSCQLDFTAELSGLRITIAPEE